jgi:hypothetical protein
MVNKILTDADRERLLDIDQAHLRAMDEWYASLANADEPTTEPPPPVPSGGWNSGVWAAHSRPTAEAWFQWINRGAEKRRHVCAFVTHNRDEAALRSNWWAGCIPAGSGLSLRIPLVPGGDTDLNKDRTATWKTIAQQATAIDPAALICPGWEMNLPGWAHKVTASNLTAWRRAWVRCYDTLKAFNPSLIIGFNPNGGDLGQTGVDIRTVLEGLPFDAIGPDQYDCWPGMTSAANINLMLTRPGGLKWWADRAAELKVKFIVPEWGVSRGTQWAGHTGGDNPTYIREMHKLFASTPHLSHESYFNEPAGYLAGDIFRLPGAGTPANPRAAAAYAELWRTVP